MINKNEIVYRYMMSKNVKNLGKVDDEFTKAKIDEIIDGECRYDAFLWQRELLSEMKIYITYLGFIDSLIMSTKKNIYLDTRNQLLDLIKKNTKLFGITNPFEFMKDELEVMPLSKKFNLIYDDMLINRYQYDLQREFMKAYNAGYELCNLVDFHSISKIFKNTVEKAETHKVYNKRKVVQTKLNSMV